LAVVVDPAGLLTAWDAEGNAVWSAAIGAEPALPSMGSKGLFLAAGTDGSLTAFSTSDGARIWSLSLASGPARGLAATDTAAFVAGADSSLFVLDGRGQTGAAVPEGLQADALVLDGDRLFVGRPDGRLECMTTAPFKALWTRRLGAPLAAEPLSDGRRVFAVVRSGVVFALDRRSGDSLWWRPLPSTSVFRPLLWNGAVVVAARSNLILAFDPVTGKPLGRFDAGLIVRAQPIITAAGLWLPVYDQERDRSAILILKIAGGSAPVTTRSGGKQP
jgi:outer membrane protein assembly factor BamB